MKPHFLMLAFVFSSLLLVQSATAQKNDAERDILVTFDNQGARIQSTGMSAPYRNRKRYSIAVAARRNANEIRDEYALLEVDHWPIRSLSIYCFVYRVPSGEDREALIDRLKSDARIESVQALQVFETGTSAKASYDDTYANLQHGLSILDVSAAHRISRGHGVRVAIIDSDADSRHEDLQGRLRKIEVFANGMAGTNAEHGTAVASVIGANANNAKGIVGIAPEARLELFVSCWTEDTADNAICDSFTLAKALDTLLDEPPDILNMSLTGPFDPLLARLLAAVQDADVAVAQDAKNVKVLLPPNERGEPANFITTLLTIHIDPSLIQTEARIVINEKQGIILVTGNVQISPVGIAHRGLSITTITPEPVATVQQPIYTERRYIGLDTTQQQTRMSTRLLDLLSALDQLKVPVEDQIAIIYEMQKTGALHARIVTR